MSSGAVADDGQIHHAECCAVAEVVNPSDNVSGQRIPRLLDRLSEHHCAEAGEDFEEFHGRHHRLDAPFLREYKRQAEDIISQSREQSGDQPSANRSPKLAVALPARKPREDFPGIFLLGAPNSWPAPSGAASDGAIECLVGRCNIYPVAFGEMTDFRKCSGQSTFSKLKILSLEISNQCLGATPAKKVIRSVPTVNKQILIRNIIARLATELELYQKAARSARSEATDEQSKAENKYDTRGLEASYLARGHSRQAAEIEQCIKAFESLPVRAFSPSDPIDLGALVELGGGGERTFYFIGPRAGGTEIRQGEQEVLVITPESPLGQQLMGKKQGDQLQIVVTGLRKQFRIGSIC